MKKILFFTIACIGIYSCNDLTKKDNNSKINNDRAAQIQEDIVKDQFVLKFNAIIENDDKFTLFYLEEDQKEITNKNSVSLNVLGSLTQQSLNFKIKEEIIPFKLFLKFENDSKTQKISIIKTELFYGEKSIVIEKEKFYQFFNPNEFIDYDRKNYVAISKPIKGNYKPRFGSRAVLDDKILLQFD